MLQNNIKKLIDKQFKRKDNFVYLGWLKLEDEAVKYLIIKQTERIVHLDMRFNNITHIGIITLQQANWDQLLMLCLRRNKIGDRGIKLLSQINFPKLTSIWLNQNKIGSSGANHLSKASWKHLQRFDLSQNKLTRTAIISISKANWKQLKLLGFAQSNLNSEEAKQLLILDCINLQLMWLWKNRIQLCNVNGLKVCLCCKFMLSESQIKF